MFKTVESKDRSLKEAFFQLGIKSSSELTAELEENANKNIN